RAEPVSDRGGHAPRRRVSRLARRGADPRLSGGTAPACPATVAPKSPEPGRRGQHRLRNGETRPDPGCPGTFNLLHDSYDLLGPIVRVAAGGRAGGRRVALRRGGPL